MMPLNELIVLLNTVYMPSYGTVLRGGFDEPFYLAARPGKAAEIRFTRDYYRSALHELAHWCVAGKERRKIDDFGYWYAPDGRTQEQQDEFFRVEVKPQAIEWALSLCCGVKFDVSVDNLSNAVAGIQEFKSRVLRQLQIYLNKGFPARTETLLRVIHHSCKNGSQPLYPYLYALLLTETEYQK
jgi:elongation factor P hydroxylase